MSALADDYPEAWRGSVTDRCVGWTQRDERCAHTRPGIYRDTEVYLCRQHVHLTPGAADGWRAALTAIREHYGASAEVVRDITAAQITERVYFASDGKYMKIGTALDPQDRVKSLQRDPQNAPADIDRPAIVLLTSIPGGHRVENRLHHRASAWRVSGEWFTDDPDLRELLFDLGVDDLRSWIAAAPTQAKR